MQQYQVSHSHLVIEPFWDQKDMVHEQQTIGWDDMYSVSDCIIREVLDVSVPRRAPTTT